MDTLSVVVLAGSVIGQVCHVVKKRLEEGKEGGETEWGILRKWVFARPVNTISSALVGWGASAGLIASTTTDPVLAFCQAVVTGIAANSFVNRPGV